MISLVPSWKYNFPEVLALLILSILHAYSVKHSLQIHNMAPEKPFHVAVCGGGIGGLCLVIGLLRQKVSCTIYEAAPAFAEIGAGVSFGPNAVRAMELIHPLIAKGFENCVTLNGWPEKKETWFDFRVGKSESRDGQEALIDAHVANVKSGKLGQTSVHRAHYLDELVKLVPDGVAKFGKRLKDITEDGEKLALLFEDGTREEADAVIGCDGIKSRTRHILLGANHPAANAVFSGKYAYRGLIPMDKAVRALGDELARNSQIYMGHHGHVLTFPIDQGKIMNVVAFRTKLDGKWEDPMWVRPSTTEDMFADFVGWGDKVQSILGVSHISAIINYHIKAKESVAHGKSGCMGVV
jgi:salicylate hydroxylase